MTDEQNEPARAGRLSSGQARLLDDAMGGQRPAAGGLTDIEHVVILMQENRSFDHYTCPPGGGRIPAT